MRVQVMRITRMRSQVSHLRSDSEEAFLSWHTYYGRWRLLLRCVDPYDVQVTEVHALLVQESGAGAALGAQMMLRGVRGGSDRRNCNFIEIRSQPAKAFQL